MESIDVYGYKSSPVNNDVKLKITRT